MKIRSITYFDDLTWGLDGSQLRKAMDFIEAARDSFGSKISVQTTRLATPPFAQVLGLNFEKEVVQYAQELEERLISRGFDYISIGPALPNYPVSYQILPEILASTDKIFVTGIISSNESGIAFSAIKACAAAIKQNAEISPDGFANLRFAALANVLPGSPFFPAAFHTTHQEPFFAIATESADLAAEAVAKATSLEQARSLLVKAIESQSELLSTIAIKLEKRFGLTFGGIDFSLAPYPLPESSIGRTIEGLGAARIGDYGSLAAVAVLTEALSQAQFKRIGFNGVMLPVLEDTVLAKRTLEGGLELPDLLLYSAVCGTGLDTIPLPGEVSEGQLFGILLDLAALAQRLDKPLTARLMPIPGKMAGDRTEFNFEYFANSKVMSLDSRPPRGLFTGDNDYHLASK